jgi:hypothetical protein
MGDIDQTINLPMPLKVKPSIAKYLDRLQEEGKTIWAFEGSAFIESLFLLYLINKYKSKCVAKGSLRLHRRPIGITIPLKTKYLKEEELELSKEFNETAKIIADCVKNGEKIILIPLTYVRGSSGHSNMLIYKVNNNEIEHYEPHGGEYIGNEKLQQSSKKILLFFINILNKYLKKDGFKEAKYVEASNVCPYIKGLQTLEAESSLKKIGKLEPAGYCTAWSLFFAELNLKNPNLTSNDVLDNIYNYLTTKKSGPDYLRSVIRGYAGYIYQSVDQYLDIFFKPRVKIERLIGKGYSNIVKIRTINDVINVLVDMEIAIISDPTFDYKKELQTVMKEYKKHVEGKSKEQQRNMRLSDVNVRNLYYKKRILQNYEEYKKDGKISEPIFDSPEEIMREDIINLDITKKGLMHEERQRRIAEIKSRPEYIEAKKKTKTKTNIKTIKSPTKGKTLKVRKEDTKKNPELTM